MESREVFYPESDGKPTAENTIQFGWIERAKGNIEAIFADNPDVFVAADNLWYPVEGDPSVAVQYGVERQPRDCGCLSTLFCRLVIAVAAETPGCFYFTS